MEGCDSIGLIPSPRVPLEGYGVIRIPYGRDVIGFFEDFLFAPIGTSRRVKRRLARVGLSLVRSKPGRSHRRMQSTSSNHVGVCSHWETPESLEEGQ